MVASEERVPADISTDVPTPARMYDYCLGGKDNFAVDRAAVMEVSRRYPGGVDAARQNRLFLYRVVRFLARDAGVRQFLDMGSGLPTQTNVHQVAQKFQPDATVTYVDNDPIVLAHGRALLSENEKSKVIMADITKPREVMRDAETRKLIDFSQPVAVLFLSVLHSISDDDTVRSTLADVADELAPGGYVALSQIVAQDAEMAAEATTMAIGLGLDWKTRTAAQVAEFMPDLEPVEPGLVDVNGWRPDPGQPPLNPVDAPLRPYIGAGPADKPIMEFGGVLRKS